MLAIATGSSISSLSKVFCSSGSGPLGISEIIHLSCSRYESTSIEELWIYDMDDEGDVFLNVIIMAVQCKQWTVFVHLRYLLEERYVSIQKLIYYVLELQ